MVVPSSLQAMECRGILAPTDAATLLDRLSSSINCSSSPADAKTCEPVRKSTEVAAACKQHWYSMNGWHSLHIHCSCVPSAWQAFLTAAGVPNYSPICPTTVTDALSGRHVSQLLSALERTCWGTHRGIMCVSLLLFQQVSTCQNKSWRVYTLCSIL